MSFSCDLGADFVSFGGCSLAVFGVENVGFWDVFAV